MRKINIQNLDRKRVITIAIIIFAIICIILTISLYIAQKDVRDWIDIYILRKNLTENDTQTINLNTDKSNQVYVYSNYIAILNDKAVSLYNSYGEKVTTINVNINSAVFDSSDKYFAVAEKKGHEICLIIDKNYLWSTTTEGEIIQVHVNQNGYVAVITEDVNHKSILTFYNSEGTKIFTSYFSSTRIIDASISNDNKYVAIAEIDTSGTIIKSKVKIISVQNAKEDPENTIIYTYSADDGNLIANVKYQEKGQIACIYDNGLNIIKNEQNKGILKIDNENITFIENNLKNHVVYIEEKKSGLFKAESNIYIINTSNNQNTIYRLDNVAKNIYAKENTIVVNAGIEMYFINTSGWLIKKYTASQEMTDIKFSDDLAAIIYKDKIVIIDL